MILDAIIGLIESIFSLIAEGFIMAFVPLLNVIAGGIEAVVGIFVSGFSLGRIERKHGNSKSTASVIGGLAKLLIVIGLMGCLLMAPKIMNQEVTLIAEDGHSLPFAALIIQTKDGKQHERTDNAGNVVIPRFGTMSITVKDPRYVEKTWEKSEIGSELIVERTILGSGLDSLADKLLKPAKH